MAFMQFTSANLPVAVGPRRESVPQVTISDKGRLSFSAAASEPLKGAKYVAVFGDLEGHKLQLIPVAELPKGVDAATCETKGYFSVPQGTTKQVSIAGSRILQVMKYDYVLAGSQVYPVEQGKTAKGAVTLLFTLPAKTPARRPPGPPRKKRAKNLPAAAAARTADPEPEPEV